MSNVSRFSPPETGLRQRPDRYERASVREERLRAASGSRDPSSIAAWRGRSGRRYVVGVHTVRSGVSDLDAAVVIAVERGSDGGARVVAVASQEPAVPRMARLRWLAKMRNRGATEMHVHLLADSEDDRRAVLRDLTGRVSGSA